MSGWQGSSSSSGCVVFSYANWALRYPELANPPAPAVPVSSALAQVYFSEATLYLSSGPGSIVRDVGQRATLLNMLVAHIAALNQTTTDGTPVSTLVGRIASGTQGSVSVSTQYQSDPGSAAWYQQTKYGAAFDAAMLPYRSARPVSSRRAGGRSYGGGLWPRRL